MREARLDSIRKDINNTTIAYTVGDAHREAKPVGNREVLQYLDAPRSDVVSCSVVPVRRAKLESTIERTLFSATLPLRQWWAWRRAMPLVFFLCTLKDGVSSGILAGKVWIGLWGFDGTLVEKDMHNGCCRSKDFGIHTPVPVSVPPSVPPFCSTYITGDGFSDVLEHGATVPRAKSNGTHLPLMLIATPVLYSFS